MKIHVHIKNKFKNKAQTVICANQSIARISGTINLPIYVRRQKFNVNFLVLDNASSDIFLGLPFLKDHRAILNFTKDPFSSISKTRCLPADSFTIEPFSEVICKGKLAHSCPATVEGHCFASPSIHTKVF